MDYSVESSAERCTASKRVDQYSDGRVHTFTISCTRKPHHVKKHAFQWKRVTMTAEERR